MKTFKEFLSEDITKTQMADIEKFADKLFAAVDVDVDLTSKHFLARINDTRNGETISSAEIIGIFKKLFKKHGKKIGKMKPGLQGVIQDFNNNDNIPFMMKWDKKNDELDMIAKTFMKKKGFKPAATDTKLEI
jgi:hypothetical protein